MAYGRTASVRGEAFHEAGFSVGDFGFLTSTGDRMTISRTPSTGNMNDIPRLSGWLGSWNNVSSYAEGVGRVVAVDSDTESVRYVPVPSSKRAAALEALGYPELAS